eukprot:4310413-Pyramimonas_sp.AAC.2
MDLYLLAGALLEDGVLVLRHGEHHLLHSHQVRVAALTHVPTHDGQHLLVERHHEVDGALADLQRGHVRQKVVPHEEAEKHKVIKEAVVVQLEAHRLLGPHVVRQVLPQNPNVQQLHPPRRPPRTASP